MPSATPPRWQPWVPGPGPSPCPPIVGLTVARHTPVTCTGGSKCEPAQTRPCIPGDSGLTLQPLTEMMLPKVDETTTVLEFSTRERCSEILRDGGTSLSVCPLPPPPHSEIRNAFIWCEVRASGSPSGGVSPSVPAQTGCTRGPPTEETLAE